MYFKEKSKNIYIRIITIEKQDMNSLKKSPTIDSISSVDLEVIFAELESLKPGEFMISNITDDIIDQLLNPYDFNCHRQKSLPTEW
jgi:hypothetical protein